VRAIAAGLALCCVLFSFGAPSLAQQARQEGVVATQKSALRVREAPAPNARVIAAAGHRERVVVLDKSPDGAWLRIETMRGEVGWVSARYISLLAPEPPPQDGVGYAPFLIAAIGFAAFLLWRWRRARAASGKRAMDEAPAAPPRQESAPARRGLAPALRLAIPAALGAAVIGGLYFVFQPTEPGRDAPGPVAEPSPELPQANQAPVVDVDACRDALALLEPEPHDTPQQREAKDLERRWVQYLEEIQSQADHANWSGQPCELYARNHRRSAREAVALGLATIEAQGNGLKSVTLRVTLNGATGTSIIVPVGTQFTSGSAGTQNMMAAASIRFSFAPVPAGDTRAAAGPLESLRFMLDRPSLIGAARAGERYGLRQAMYRPPSGPRTYVGEVPAYCINRWRNVPGADAAFSVSYPDEASPLPRLLSCLEKQPAEHGVKQLAVWMISDDLVNLTPAQLEERIFEEVKGKARHLTGAELAEIAKQRNASISEDLLRQMRSLSSAEVEQVQSILLRRLAQEDARAYAEAGPLLQACGYDTADSAFFREQK
jgi:hypothetical protein